MELLDILRRRIHFQGAAAVSYIVSVIILALLPDITGLVRFVMLQGLTGRKMIRGKTWKGQRPNGSPLSLGNMDAARARGRWKIWMGISMVRKVALVVTVLELMIKLGKVTVVIGRDLWVRG